LLEAALEPVVRDMGFELLLLEWLGSGKRRVMRIFLDSPKGVTVEDCSRMSRILGASLDAAEAAGKAGEGDPALAALLDRAYTLEVSSPGVDRPLARRRHFEQQLGHKIKLELDEALTELAGPLEAQSPANPQLRFTGRVLAVQDDPARPEDGEAALIVLALEAEKPEHARTLHVPLARIRRANLVWEG
jgi:ribosome maturation factor RimP